MKKTAWHVLIVLILGFSLTGFADETPSVSGPTSPPPAQSPPTKSRTALIYRGPGSCAGCPEAVGILLAGMGLNVQYIGAGELTKARFRHADLYVQPGGTDRDEDTMEALKSWEVQNLRDFVSHGGHFLGICAGGYLAGQATDGPEHMPAFRFLPISADNESVSKTARLEPILWRGEHRMLYFQDGPSFNLDELSDVEIWATYEKTGHGAALVVPFGRGRVAVIGPHVEAQPDWYEEDHLSEPEQPTMDLGVDFITSLLEPAAQKKGKWVVPPRTVPYGVKSK